MSDTWQGWSRLEMPQIGFLNRYGTDRIKQFHNP